MKKSKLIFFIIDNRMLDMKNKELIKTITFNGLLAALYTIFTIAIAPLSYGAIQFRFSEVLVLLVFFNKKYAYGLTLGCFLANLFSPTMALDILFGTSATLLACLAMMFCKHLAVAAIFPVLFNAFIIGWELTYFGEPFWFSCGYVALGELGVMVIGYIIFFLLRKRENFWKAIDATQNTDFKF